MTFAIAARCAETGRLGVAISTRSIAVSSRCPFIAPGLGLVVTLMQRTDPRLGPLGLNLLRLESARSGFSMKSLPVTRELNIARSVSLTGMAMPRHAPAKTIACGLVLLSSAAWWRWATISPVKKLLQTCVMSGMQPKARPSKSACCAHWRQGVMLAARTAVSIQPACIPMIAKIYAYVDLRVDEHVEPVGELRRIYNEQKPLIPDHYGRPGR